MQPPIGLKLLFEPLVTQFLSGNIECAVDVGIDRRTVGSTVQPALFSIAGKLSLDRLFIDSVVRHNIEIQGAGFGGVAFLTNNHLDAVSLCLVLHLVNEAGMRNENKILIVHLTQVAFRLPLRVHRLADGLTPIQKREAPDEKSFPSTISEGRIKASQGRCRPRRPEPAERRNRECRG